jgi:hypothetical protein
VPSLKSFYDDTEFIEFLKNISLYVTNEEEQLNTEGGGYLFKNLQFLRERFKDFKSKKTT